MKSIKIYSVLFIILSLGNLAKAQLGKEAWHWQFGQYISLDFSSGLPVVGTSSINTSEGCASISDSGTGQLLFYTDGISVWDRNNNQMPNGHGLFGNSSTTQSALIIPKPGNQSIYYIITCDAFGSTKGVCYSMVDMNLNGGLGDITVKNTLLTSPPTTEKLTAVKHRDNINYWIINHSFNSNTFNVYIVTSSGISSTPIISNVGTIENNISGGGLEAAGYLKASPNGKKLALAIEVNIPILEIYDFNDSTGQINNPITINYSGAWNGPYGVSFSPDNSKVYASDPDKGYLYQYDLSSDTASIIIASQNIIDTAYTGSALQIAPNGKIYIAYNGGSLSVINSPNNLGLACNYQDSAVIFTPGTCQEGLPNFIYTSNSSPTLIKKYVNDLADIIIYPNPNKGNFHIQYDLRENAQLELSDINGNLVGSYILPDGSSHTEVKNNDLKNGVYFYRIMDANGVVLKIGKIVVMQ